MDDTRIDTRIRYSLKKSEAGMLRVSAHALALNSIIPSCTRGAPTVTKARGSKTQKGRMRWRTVEEKKKVSFVNRVETEKNRVETEKNRVETEGTGTRQ